MLRLKGVGYGLAYHRAGVTSMPLGQRLEGLGWFFCVSLYPNTDA